VSEYNILRNYSSNNSNAYFGIAVFSLLVNALLIAYSFILYVQSSTKLAP